MNKITNWASNHKKTVAFIVAVLWLGHNFHYFNVPGKPGGIVEEIPLTDQLLVINLQPEWDGDYCTVVDSKLSVLSPFLTAPKFTGLFAPRDNRTSSP